MVHTLCGIVYASEKGFLANIAYPGAEGNGDSRASAIEAAVKRFETLYIGPVQDGATLQLDSNYDAARLAAEQQVEFSAGQRWVVEDVRSLPASTGPIELTFYRPGSKNQQVSHRESVRDACRQTVDMAK